jgi:hypothetical protein
VDPRHPAAAMNLRGLPAVPFATLTKACAVAQPGDTIVLRGGVYRDTLRPLCDGITIRAMDGERVIISGADVIENWQRESNGTWSAPLALTPKTILRDGKGFRDFNYDVSARRVTVRGDDPRLHLFETVVREKAIDTAGKTNVSIKDINTENPVR